MESVTLGVVGDSFSGKTLLATSYTANYVYKQYKATVLNCHWTNAVVDGKVIDVTIWDSSGSDEYNKLRPLSYLQTNVFLVCFSLKNRTSFENIERKWIPEVKKHNADAKFLIVGCKRDDCLKSSREDLLNIVTSDEGEMLAKRLGAVIYVETSAIQQSGLTQCFQTAIRTAVTCQQLKRGSPHVTAHLRQ